MHALTSIRHRLLACTLTSLLLAILAPSVSGQEDRSIALELRPHCEDLGWTEEFGGPVPDNPFMTTLTPATCPEFEVKDPLTRQTPVLRDNETLDMDLVIRNPAGSAVSRVRAWIAYDPMLLRGENISLHPSFTMPTPDEQTFSDRNGYVKIGAGADTPPREAVIAVARIRMRVQATSDTQTILSFFNATGDVESETAVVTTEARAEQSLLQLPLGSLLVRMRERVSGSATGVATSSAAPSALSAPAPASQPAGTLPSVVDVSALPQDGSTTSAVSTESAASTASALSVPETMQTGGAFTLLQVQNLRATTDQSTAYLAWDPLHSAELIGYNVYYGAISGEYLHRRSVDRTATTLMLRDLPQGVRYYFAVRGVNGSNQETEFSQEVAVVIGQPQTSTAPLLASLLPKGPQGKTPATHGSIAGSTGNTSTVLLLVIASAGIGTALAFRRQFVALHRRP